MKVQQVDDEVASGFLSVVAHLQMIVNKHWKASGHTLDKAQDSSQLNVCVGATCFFFLLQIVMETHSRRDLLLCIVVHKQLLNILRLKVTKQVSHLVSMQ